MPSAVTVMPEARMRLVRAVTILQARGWPDHAGELGVQLHAVGGDFGEPGEGGVPLPRNRRARSCSAARKAASAPRAPKSRRAACSVSSMRRQPRGRLDARARGRRSLRQGGTRDLGGGEVDLHEDVAALSAQAGEDFGVLLEHDLGRWRTSRCRALGDERVGADELAVGRAEAGRRLEAGDGEIVEAADGLEDGLDVGLADDAGGGVGGDDEAAGDAEIVERADEVSRAAVDQRDADIDGIAGAAFTQARGDHALRARPFMTWARKVSSVQAVERGQRPPGSARMEIEDVSALHVHSAARAEGDGGVGGGVVHGPPSLRRGAIQASAGDKRFGGGKSSLRADCRSDGGTGQGVGCDAAGRLRWSPSQCAAARPRCS